ncbi:MAG: DUF2344 domain-containing protein [Thermosipho sp. (in: Bacteria)]|nr:DUF2344 domain-containing protein [Thermosipho sp. (in: thermotogales)]
MNREYTILFKKLGLYRFISALDTITMIERTFRRSGLKLCYTEGFHPKPKFSYIDPVPTGVIDLAFYFNICLKESYNPNYVFNSLQKVQPEFLKVVKVFNKSINLSKTNKFKFSIIVKKPFVFNKDGIIEKKTKRGTKIIQLANLENVEIFEKKDYIVLNYIVGKENLFNPYLFSENVYLALRKEAYIDDKSISDILNK